MGLPIETNARLCGISSQRYLVSWYQPLMIPGIVVSAFDDTRYRGFGRPDTNDTSWYHTFDTLAWGQDRARGGEFSQA